MTARDKVKKIMDDAGFGFMATEAGGQPKVRPMSFVLTDAGRLWSSTYRESGKMNELDSNGRVEICFIDSGYVQLRIEGVASLDGGTDKKKKLLRLNPKVKNHFKDEKDPKFVLIEVVPTKIKVKGTGFGDYEELSTVEL